MPNSLKKLIEKQLKENVPLSQIKQGLKEKGYQLEEINRAVQEVISNVDRKLPVHVFQISVLVVGILVIIGVVLYLNFGSNPTGNGLCRNYQISSAISCEEAADIALVNAPGTIQKISTGTVRVLDAESGQRITVDVWFMDISLTTPYFDKTFQKTVKIMRIGVGMDENFGIYKEPLESL